MCAALASRTIIGSLNDEFKTDLYEFFVSAHNMPRHDNLLTVVLLKKTLIRVVSLRILSTCKPVMQISSVR